MLPRAPLRSAASWRSPKSPTSAAGSAGQGPLTDASRLPRGPSKLY